MIMNIEDIIEISKDFICTDRYVYNGINVPRATEIISKCIHEESIVKWANNLGFNHKSYNKELDKAANYGTKVHHSIELYLQNKDIPNDEITVSLDAFKNWWNQINRSNKITILGQEQKLVCRWYGGTYDLLIRINDKVFLVDFKTSNHISFRYYIQLAAYNKILRDELGINIDGCIILQLNKKDSIFREYVLDLSIKSHRDYLGYCERTFMSMIYTYYHIFYLEREFKNL